jgi:hypothetical protein
VVQVSSRVWVVGPERPLEAERLVIEPGVVLGLPHPVPLDDVIKPQPRQRSTARFYMRLPSAACALLAL